MRRKGLSTAAAIGILTLIIGISLSGVSIHLYRKTNDLKERNQNLSENYTNLNENYGTLKKDYTDLMDSFENIKQEYSSIDSSYERLKANFDNLEDRFENLKDNYNHVHQQLKLLKSGDRFELHEPTYSELKNFLKSDLTNQNQYDLDDYNCFDFTKDLIKNAMDRGMMVGFVRIQWVHQGEEGAHAVAVFDTVDEKRVYVEPQEDIIFKELEVGDYYYDLLEEYSDKNFPPSNDYRIIDFDVIW